MKLKPILFLAILLVSVLSVFPLQVQEVKAQNPNSNTVTFYGTPDMVILNWTEFWQLFRQHAYWKLEGDRGLGWEDASEYLIVQRNYMNNGSTCKVTLIFDAPLTANYRLTFAIDKKAREYTHKEGTYNYALVYEGYVVIFDWSDILSIPSLIVTHGMKDVSGEQWFWFRIQKDDVQKAVHIVIDPSITAYTTSSDGNIQCTGGEGTDYNDVWNAASGTVQDGVTSATLGQQYVFMDDYYRIYRSFVFFNTSSLTNNVEVQSATLSIYGSEELINKGFSIVIQNGQPTYPHDSLEGGDYDKDNYTGSGGQQYYFEANFTVTDYNNITLNSDGIGWINLTGITKLCLRSSLDIAGTPPGVTYETASFWTNEKGEGYRPALTITYALLYNLNLKTIDSSSNIIEGATVYANTTTETSDSNGWANFTGYDLNDVVDVKVKYQNV